MKRIGILTAGGDTPALNATVHGAVVRANQRRVEVYGFIKGYSALLNPSVPHVHLNPLFTEIPELDPTRGGTVIGASRAFVDPDDSETIAQIADRLKQLKIDGLICVGGDGTLNGLQPFAELLPRRARPQDDRQRPRPQLPQRARRVGARAPARSPRATATSSAARSAAFDLDGMVNYVTPGLRHRGLRLGPGRAARPHHRREPPPHRDHRGDGPPLRLHRPRHRLRPARHHPRPRGPGRIPALVERVRELYELQKNVVIVCGEGIVDEDGRELGAKRETHDPAGNIVALGRLGRAARRARRPLRRRSTSSSTAGPSRPRPRSSPERSATPSAAAGRSCSTASTPPSSGARRWTCCSTGRTTRSRSCSGTASGASTSTATTATPSATAGASSTPATCTRASTTRS